MNTNRRDFLKGTAWMGAAALAAGCHLNRLGFGEGGLMQGYAYRKLMGKRIRVGFVGIGGHRLVGGCRASTYNAVPYEACKALADFMKEYMEKH